MTGTGNVIVFRLMERTHIDRRIADSRKRLETIASQIDRLKLEAISLEGEIRGYENILADFQSSESRAPTTIGKESVNRKWEREEHHFRLSPIWHDIFIATVDSFPQGITRDKLKDIAKAHGPLPKSFHTAVHHHVTRGNLDRREGLYFANEKTAQRIGRVLRNSASDAI